MTLKKKKSKLVSYCCLFVVGDQAADEERIHFRVFPRQEINVCVLYS